MKSVGEIILGFTPPNLILQIITGAISLLQLRNETGRKIQTWIVSLYDRLHVISMFSMDTLPSI
jgi:hypothetical protein